ncbi:hypothetical protein [Streptomyces avermitilis]|uniref:hypothetical protein n=1 Tax=Streptomyces avermitilis TaxID=33903 RepID=UPI0033BD1E18
MDAGIAAVLGALAGTIGTVMTGWASRSVAKMQMRVDLIREGRAPRRASYESFAAAATALRDHLAPWITFGRHFQRPSETYPGSWDGVVVVKQGDFKDGFVSRAVELADDLSRCGRGVIFEGPSLLEPQVTKVMETAAEIASPFRVMQMLDAAADGEGTSAYDTSRLPDQLKLLEQSIRAFLLGAGAALDDQPSRQRLPHKLRLTGRQ